MTSGLRLRLSPVGAPGQREARGSLKAAGCDCGADQAGSGLPGADNPDSCHRGDGDGSSHGALRGPELACADQGPSLALGAPSRSLTLAPVSLFCGSVAHVLLAIFPVYHLLAPFLACPMTLIPQLCELLQLGDGASCGLCPAANTANT